MTQMLSDAVAGLRAQMVGDVVTPEHAAYDDFRKVWNADIDKRPAIIARCASVDDVRTALAFGREQGFAIAVKAGGHSFPGHSTCDDGLVIDLRPMNRVSVDAERRRAVVQGGAVWGEVDNATTPLGLAVTGGHVSHTGVAGLTLGGGVGHLHRAFGLSTDNLVSAQMVTADGRLLRASEDENADLFWAIRGGGGNFGIATEFEFNLHPIPPTVFAGLIFYAPENGPELMRMYNEAARDLPESMNTILAYLHAPPFPFVPEPVQFKPGYALVAVCLDQDLGERHLQPFREFGPPLFEMLAPMPYNPAVQTLFDPALPWGTKGYVKSHYFTEFNDDVISVIHENTVKMPPGPSQMLNLQLGGAISRVDDTATAFGGRDEGFLMMAIGIWEEAEDRSAVVEWARGFSDTMAPHGSGGTYVNLADTESEDRLAASYGPKFERLREIKAKYDPENVFRLNQNIKPKD